MNTTKTKVVEKTIDVNFNSDDEVLSESNCKYSLPPRVTNNGFNLDESCFMEYEESDENSFNMAITELLPELCKGNDGDIGAAAAMTL